MVEDKIELTIKRFNSNELNLQTIVVHDFEDDYMFICKLPNGYSIVPDRSLKNIVTESK